jgi:hypothetical protein
MTSQTKPEKLILCGEIHLVTGHVSLIRLKVYEICFAGNVNIQTVSTAGHVAGLSPTYGTGSSKQAVHRTHIQIQGSATERAESGKMHVQMNMS